MGGKIRLEDRECPLSTALSYVGEWWTLLILHDCFDGYSRFDEFQANVGLSSSMLTSRLWSLVERGILERRAYQERPVRYEYVLTEFGRSLRPVLVAMAAWRNAQLAPEERAMILIDADTGREVEPVVVDAATGERVDTTSTCSPRARRPDRSCGSGTHPVPRDGARGRNFPADPKTWTRQRNRTTFRKNERSFPLLRGVRLDGVRRERLLGRSPRR
ncbi:helix-turn-helix domain-containing protein [Actinoplanes sp. NBRC 103695]|uniref:winged helix-turn-helix transcriptional regulator n=1 Tax=Actinoplanes sp. NBRC 103695 TaxID=3032202 RepID=UPI0024A3B1B1|nr:helix-turn-helix domain-containing protein [Actinoplanes sp. NBRC 103695]GLY97328.1 hypothetical protein Acsp02_45820 [Actinoplanes sp. NBRC 103695]